MNGVGDRMDEVEAAFRAYGSIGSSDWRANLQYAAGWEGWKFGDGYISAVTVLARSERDLAALPRKVANARS